MTKTSQTHRFAAFALSIIALLLPHLQTNVYSQTFEIVGVRALAMGGAFTAVADDGTAVYWNPGGLASGAIFSLVGEQVAGDQVLREEEGARSGRSRFFGLTTPPLGLSYYQLNGTVAVPGVEPGTFDVRRLTTDHVGVTVVQSLTDRVVAGATVRYVHSRAHAALVAGRVAEQALDGELARGEASNGWDLDVGLMAIFDKVRLGLVGRNLREPSVEASGGRLVLERAVRAGLAIFPSPSFILAFDLDVTPDQSEHDRRNAALGVERRWDHLKMAIRAGIRVNTKFIGEAVASAGASVTLRQNVFVEGFLAGGRTRAPQMWGLGGRVAF